MEVERSSPLKLDEKRRLGIRGSRSQSSFMIYLFVCLLDWNFFIVRFSSSCIILHYLSMHCIMC